MPAAAAGGSTCPPWKRSYVTLYPRPCSSHTTCAAARGASHPPTTVQMHGRRWRFRNSIQRPARAHTHSGASRPADSGDATGCVRRDCMHYLHDVAVGGATVAHRVAALADGEQRVLDARRHKHRRPALRHDGQDAAGRVRHDAAEQAAVCEPCRARTHALGAAARQAARRGGRQARSGPCAWARESGRALAARAAPAGGRPGAGAPRDRA